MINRDYLKRRFYEFRLGHGSYLVFAIAFIQFIIISYQLYIETVPLLKVIFPNMAIWIAFFIGTYVPLAVYVGHRVHLKSQYQNEIKQLTDKNPYTFETQPGKEQLYQLPSTILAYENQIRSMEMANISADLNEKYWPKLLPEMAGIKFPRWSQEEIMRVRYYLEMTKRLQTGEDIRTIAGA